MSKDLLTDINFASLMKEHAIEVIELLFESDINFSILTNTKYVTFEPDLPKNISDTFGPITMFTLAGYSLQSAQVDDDNLYFEAGFGSENFGSLVTIPLFSVVQIVIDEKPIYINLSNVDLRKTDDNQGVQKSMEALLSNPENQKLLSKKRD